MSVVVNCQKKYLKTFALYERVLTQNPKDKNKIYSLHEPDIYCAGKGKDHKRYEYGRKASVVSTLTDQVIIGVLAMTGMNTTQSAYRRH